MLNWIKHEWLEDWPCYLQIAELYAFVYIPQWVFA